MSDPQDPTPDEDWKTLGQGSAPHSGRGGAVAPAETTSEEKIYGRRESAPPGTISLRVGAIAFVIMAALYVFTDLRDVETPWQRSFSLVYALSLIPAFGVFWGLIGLIKRQPDDAPRAAAGIVLSLAALGLAYVTLTATPPRHDIAPVLSGDRVEMSPKELSQWREEKLRREKQ
jgi:hypothetical protein